MPIPAEDSGDLTVFFNNTERLRRAVQTVFNDYQQVRSPALKSYVDVHLRLVREVPNAEPQYRDMYMRSHVQIISSNDIATYISELSQYLINRFDMDLSDEEGSGYTLDEIVSVKMTFTLVMLHSRIGEHIPYPKGVPGKSQVLNPSGSGDCVFQVLTAYQHLKKGVDRENASINTGNIQSPVSWEDLRVLERLNNISIRVYSLDSIKGKKGDLTLVRKGLKDNEVVHCLLLGNRHLALIPNFHMFMNVFTHQRRVKKMFCDICLCACENKTALDEHKAICPVNITKLKFPPAGSKVKFINYGKTYEPSYLCFYDFESILVEPSSNGSSSCVKKQHFAIAYAYIVVNRNGKTVGSGSYCGINCVNNFIQTMQRFWKKRIIPSFAVERSFCLVPDQVAISNQ